jgi:hypothetical protein
VSEPGPDEIERPIGLVITSVIAAWVSLTAAIRAPETLRQFENLFQGFGADLPTITFITLKSGWIWWLFALPGVALAIWILMRSRITREQHRTMKIAVRSHSALLWLAIALAAWGLYAPIFKLGAVV